MHNPHPTFPKNVRVEKDGRPGPTPPLLGADKVALLVGQAFEARLGVVREVVNGLLEVQLLALLHQLLGPRRRRSQGHGPMRGTEPPGATQPLRAGPCGGQGNEKKEVEEGGRRLHGFPLSICVVEDEWGTGVC